MVYLTAYSLNLRSHKIKNKKDHVHVYMDSNNIENIWKV